MDVPECDPDLIKHIAFHDYQRNDKALDWKKLETKIDAVWLHYGKRPLWLTEFSGGRLGSTNENWGTMAPNRAEQDAYMKDVLPMLENNPRIYRYAWFNSRLNPDGHFGAANLLVYGEPNPTPTSTGEIYKDTPEGAGN